MSASMNQPTTPNTVEDFLPLPKAKGIVEYGIPGELYSRMEDGYTADQVRAAILADRAQRPTVAGSVDTPDERYEFERHMSNEGEAVNYLGDGLYGCGHMQDRWDTWRASAALSRTPAAPVVAEGLTQKIAQIADDFHPDNDSQAPQALQEMRDALQSALAAHPVAGSPAEADDNNAAVHGAWLEFAARLKPEHNNFNNQDMFFSGWKAHRSRAAEPMPASEAQQLGRMRQAFHINMLRAYPEKSHAEISAEIDKACGIAAPVPASEAASVPEGDSYKPVYWFSVLAKCARLLDLPDDEPIPSGVLKAVEALVAAPAAPTDAKVDGDLFEEMVEEGYTALAEHSDEWRGDPEASPASGRESFAVALRAALAVRSTAAAQSVRDAAQPTIAPEDTSAGDKIRLIREAENFVPPSDALDARRYRFVREHSYVELVCKSPRADGWSPAKLDSAIDSAIAATTTTPKD